MRWQKRKRKWRRILPVVGLVLFLFAPPESHANAIENQCKDTYFDITNTLRACDVVIGRQNTDRATRIRAFQVRAKVHLAAGNITAALDDFSSAISALPDGKLKGYVLFARALTRFDHYHRTDAAIALSLADLEQANNLAPGNPRIVEKLARLYEASGHYRDAIRVASIALQSDPQALAARKTRARAYEAMGKNINALSDLDILLERQKSNADLLTWRGHLHEKRRNYVHALADYRNAARHRTTQELLDRINRIERLLNRR